MTPQVTLARLGSRVRQRRKELGLTQAALATAAGVSRFTLIKLERGQLNDVNLKTVLALFRPLRLRLDISDIGASGLPVFGDEKPNGRGAR